MVNRGNIIKLSLDPVMGREQAGYRPVLVISNDTYNKRTGLAICCPISKTSNVFPLHIPLENGLRTTGQVLCQHIVTIDYSARNFRYVEDVSEEFIDNIEDIVKDIFKS